MEGSPDVFSTGQRTSLDGTLGSAKDLPKLGAITFRVSQKILKERLKEYLRWEKRKIQKVIASLTAGTSKLLEMLFKNPINIPWC